MDQPVWLLRQERPRHCSGEEAPELKRQPLAPPPAPSSCCELKRALPRSAAKGKRGQTSFGIFLSRTGGQRREQIDATRANTKEKFFIFVRCDHEKLPVS